MRSSKITINLFYVFKNIELDAVIEIVIPARSINMRHPMA